MAIIHRTANGKTLTTIRRDADDAVLNGRGVAGRNASSAAGRLARVSVSNTGILPFLVVGMPPIARAAMPQPVFPSAPSSHPILTGGADGGKGRTSARVDGARV